MNSFFNYSSDELKEILLSLGYSKYTSDQLFDWVYRKKVFNPDEMLNIKKELRQYLKENYSFSLPGIAKKEVSKDGTVKLLLTLIDGLKVECVLMHHNYGTSLCVTSEAGCNMGCAFCASGLLKKERSLEAYEMVSQILKVEEECGEKVSHVVVMGTGEPLDNLDNVLKFINIINNKIGLEIGIRHITVSTCGIVPKIYELAEKKIPLNLAISLHAPNNEIRNRLMPINKAYPLDKLIKAVSDYFDTTGRRITFEYLLLKDINDSLKCAEELANLIRGLNAYVNLIPYNRVKEFDFMPSLDTQVELFYDKLKKEGINVTIRKKMGDDISAACGQLRSQHNKSEDNEND